MKKITFFAVCAAVVLWLTGCSEQPNVAGNENSEGQEVAKPETPDEPEAPETPVDPIEDVLKYKEYKSIELTAEEKAVGQNLNVFAWKLFEKAMCELQVGDNILISPVSVSIAMSMAINGADNATLSDLLSMLGLESEQLDALNSYNSKLMHQLEELDNTVDMEFANSIWHTEIFGFLQPFVELTSDSYNADVKESTFASIVDDVNAWCSNKTHGIIERILEQPTDFCLANALYFKGNWTNKFDQKLTADAEFNCSNGTKSTVQFMHENAVTVYGYTDSYGAMIKPFGNGAYNMFVVLPDQGKSIGECVEMIKDNGEVCRNFASYLVDLSMPKFKIDKSYDLKETLSRMCEGLAFDIQTADFDKMAEAALFINAVNHAVSIEVEEGGAVAAAATVVDIATATAPEGTVDFKLDRPFLFYITETSTGSLLFIGVIDSL